MKHFLTWFEICVTCSCVHCLSHVSNTFLLFSYFRFTISRTLLRAAARKLQWLIAGLASRRKKTGLDFVLFTLFIYFVVCVWNGNWNRWVSGLKWVSFGSEIAMELGTAVRAKMGAFGGWNRWVIIRKVGLCFSYVLIITCRNLCYVKLLLLLPLLLMRLAAISGTPTFFVKCCYDDVLEKPTQV